MKNTILLASIWLTNQYYKCVFTLQYDSLSYITKTCERRTISGFYLLTYNWSIRSIHFSVDRNWKFHAICYYARCIEEVNSLIFHANIFSFNILATLYIDCIACILFVCMEIILRVACGTVPCEKIDTK